MKKTALLLLKILPILGIFAFLFWQAAQNDSFEKLFTLENKHWDFLLLAFFWQIIAVSITIVRWKWLVAVLGMPFTYKDSFRLGFLGLMLNLAPMGIVGGDGIKAYMLALRNPAHRAKALASVVVDRIIGLIGLFFVATFLVCWTGFAFREEALAKGASQLVFWLTGISVVGVGVIFLPFFSQGHFEKLIDGIPVCGKILGKLTRALLLYRNHKICLLGSTFVSLFVHLGNGLSLYCVAKGLMSSVPTVLEHLVVSPIANLTAMIPLAAGPYEIVLNQLYPLLSTTPQPGIGLFVALGYRIVSILVAAVGILYYLASKAELRQAVQEELADEATNTERKNASEADAANGLLP